MRVGAIADKGVDRSHHALRHIGVQVEGRGDRHIGADDPAYPLEQEAIGVVLLGRQRGAVRADVDGVDGQRRFQALLDRGEQLDEEPVLDRSVGLGHREGYADGVHGPEASIAATKPGVSASMRGADGARLGEDRIALEIGARGEMRLGRGRREFVALDRKAEECDARR